MQQNNTLHLEVLDENRKKVLEKLSNFKDVFYLAGGTSLALQLGHRDSIDFDFFTQDNFDENKLIEKIENIFGLENTQIIQLERGTVTAIVDRKVKISFFNYKYNLLEKTIDTEYLNLASVLDIACMKMSAICSRSTNKDYVDLYFILKDMGLKSILESVKIKYPTLDINVVLKSLVYFEDIESEPLMMYLEKDLDFKIVENFLIKKVKEYINI
jgi:phosphopantetheine adenylyltransferase